MPTSHWVYKKVLPQKWTPHRGQSSISWQCLTTLMDCTNQLSTLKSIPRELAPLPLSHVTFLLGDRINIQNIIDSLLIACLIIFSTCLAVLTDLSHQYVLEAWKCNTITVFYLIIELRRYISVQYWPENKNQHDQEINYQHQFHYLIPYFAGDFSITYIASGINITMQPLLCRN